MEELAPVLPRPDVP